MTDDLIPTPEDTDDVLAAELALGLLEPVEQVAAEARLANDAAFAARVAQWRAHFGVLVAEIPDAAAPADGAERLMRAIDVAAPRAANDYRLVRLWQGATGAAALLAATLAAVLVLRPPPPAPVVVQRSVPLLIASIDPGSNGAPVAAAYYPDVAELRVNAAQLTDAGHSAELWVIAADGVPHSLGVLPPGKPRTVRIAGANLTRFVSGSKLVVTREQPGGSPDGTPKGPAVAAGPLLAI